MHFGFVGADALETGVNMRLMSASVNFLLGVSPSERLRHFASCILDLLEKEYVDLASRGARCF